MKPKAGSLKRSIKSKPLRTSLVVQRLGLHTSTTQDMGSILDQELRSCMPHGAVKNQKKKKGKNKTKNKLLVRLTKIKRERNKITNIRNERGKRRPIWCV